MSKDLKYWLVPKKHVTRHKILKILLDKFYENHKKPFNLKNYETSIKSLQVCLGLDEKYIRDCIVLLVIDKEAKYFNSQDGLEFIMYDTNTIQSVNENKYINLGRKLVFDTIDYYFKLLSGMALFVIAIVTFSKSCREESKVESLQQNVKKLQEETLHLQNQIQKITHVDSVSLYKK